MSPVRATDVLPLFGPPHEEEPARNHPDAPLAEQPGEFGQCQGRFRAEDVHEHDHEVDAGVVARHPAEVGTESVVLEAAELLEREEVDPRQGEREPHGERQVRIDLERDDLLRAGEAVDHFGGTRDAVRALHPEVGDEQDDGECRVSTCECGERVIHDHYSLLWGRLVTA